MENEYLELLRILKKYIYYSDSSGCIRMRIIYDNMYTGKDFNKIKERLEKEDEYDKLIG